MQTSFNTHTDRRTKRHICLSVCLFARLSVMSARGVHSMGERSAKLHRNLRGELLLEMVHIDAKVYNAVHHHWFSDGYSEKTDLRLINLLS